MIKNINIWAKKLNIAIAINEIGPNKTIKLVFANDGKFMVSCKKDDYYPSDQGPIKKWNWEAEIKISPDDCEGEWAKYAAEDLLSLIEQQMQQPHLKIVK